MPDYDIDSTPHFLAIGKSVVGFERVTQQLRFYYGCILQNAGLKTWKLSENILVIKTFGAPDLAKAYCAAILILSASGELKPRAEKCMKEVQQLSELRNKIVHGDWHISTHMTITAELPPIKNESLLGGIKRKSTKKGTETEVLPSVSEMKIFAERCDQVVFEIGKIFQLLAIELEPLNSP